tara:strand:+ start:400 stop:600 length:201 start_codon:yes stop_codon:yes gene_type:complete
MSLDVQHLHKQLDAIAVLKDASASGFDRKLRSQIVKNFRVWHGLEKEQTENVIDKWHHLKLKEEER